MFSIIIILLTFLDTSSCFPLTINYSIANCYNNGSTYPLNGTYETSLNNLLSTLVSQISKTKNGFITNKQTSTNDQYLVYGLALCRGDMSSQECGACVKVAREEVTKNCTRAIEAIIWKEQCMIRYSNKPFFSLPQTQPNIPMFNFNVSNDVGGWIDLLNRTLNEVITMATSNENRYATKEASFAPLNKLMYTMAQCTPDLTAANCSNCLDTAVSLMNEKYLLNQGAITLTPSCTLRRELYPFYQILAPPNTSVPTTTPSTNTSVPTTTPSTNTSLPTTTSSKRRGNNKLVVAIALPLAALGVLIVLGIYFLLRRKRANKSKASLDLKNVFQDLPTTESLMFELQVIEAATNNFSDEHKLGQGGFGSVYKGTLPNGQEIAVKRLSKISSQGVEEFKNEVVLIANLQHRNLVRLLGFCLAGEEKLLVYEFVPNKSLNYFLFGVGKRTELNWPIRYNIIKGIARGLLYLHEDSRPRIIHRDLKSGNILLDVNMNPKISDFGLARIFKVEQTEDNTNRVVGTYGYMAPEYAMHGQFSIKSDVFSFGVLVLEIISGKKITERFHPSRPGDLLTHAWRSFTEQNLMEFMDPTLQDSYSSEEVMRCIHFGILCAQDNTNDRPTMSTIVHILNSDSTNNITLSMPQCPRSFYSNSIESSVVSSLLSQNTTRSTAMSSIENSNN